MHWMKLPGAQPAMTVPKFVSPSDPAAQWTGAHKGHAFFAYADNYLIDLKAAVILDVEATRAIRQAEVGAARTMIERTADRFGLKPERLAADSAYGSAPSLDWLVETKGIAPHIPVFDKSKRDDGTFSRSDFQFDTAGNLYTCPAGKPLTYARNDRQRRTGPLPRQQARLHAVPVEGSMLSEAAGPQDPAQHLRTIPGRCPLAGRHGAL